MVRSTTTTSTKSSSSKPYDRLTTKTKDKANAKAPHGAPSQLSQSSRKGKKAWRKNVDVSLEEEALEHAREEERVTGGKIVDKKTDELFLVDIVGDAKVAERMRKAPKPLRSLAILSERSAVPSLFSRPTPSSSRGTRIAAAEKARLRRIARRTNDPVGSADVKKTTSELQDAWTESAPIRVASDFGSEGMIRPTVKPPSTLQRRRELYLSSQVQGGRALEAPEGGVSYNPSAESHQRLLEMAVDEEKERLLKEAKDEERIRALSEVVNARRQAVGGNELVDGMAIGPGDAGSDAEASEAAEERRTKPTKRKTQAQRNKKLRARETARLAALESTQRRIIKSIASVPALQSSLEKREKALAEADRLAKMAKRERERLGLEGGEKVGKHRVGKGSVAVQLGEDLAETLRQIKPEGNLFKDRFLALQKRALIEPRVPQLPKRRARKIIEYEKHAYKRFT